MLYSLFRSWRALLPIFILLAGSLVLLVSWPDRIPTAESSPFKRVPWSEGGVLRVGSPEPERQASVLSPYGPGFEFELVTAFCKQVSCTPEWVTVKTKAAGFDLLQNGEIDVLVGFWGGAPPVVQDVKKGETEVAIMGDPPPIARGKAYAHFNPVRISGTTVPRSTTEEAGLIPQKENPASLSAMDALRWTFASLFPPFAQNAPDPETGFGDDKQPFPVFSFISDGKGDKTDIVLVDPASFALWRPFLGDVSSRRVNEKTPYRWYWRDDATPLAAHLAYFWKNPSREAEIAELTERYFGFLPRTLHQRDILELAEALSTRLPLYEEFITKAAKETGVPPLLLVAAIYQESRFDPGAVSETKVRGIMQLTTATAEMLGVDRKDPEQCIMGGARYLRDLWERVGDKADNDWDRWFMALAAYNQGMSNVNRTIRLAQEMGKKGNTWADLKQAFPLSTTCRGVEAKFFVERIRYYNFILHGLVALAPAEAQDFAPLLGLAVADSDF